MSVSILVSLYQLLGTIHNICKVGVLIFDHYKKKNVSVSNPSQTCGIGLETQN